MFKFKPMVATMVSCQHYPHMRPVNNSPNNAPVPQRRYDDEERADYEDHEIARQQNARRWKSNPEREYRTLSHIHSAYGSLFAFAGLLVLFVGMTGLTRNSKNSELLNIVLLMFGFISFGVFVLVRSVRMWNWKSIWDIRILSFIACVLGLFPILGYAFTGWTGVMGFCVSVQIPIRKRFGLKIPEFFESSSNITNEQWIFDPSIREKQLALQTQMITSFNDRYLHRVFLEGVAIFILLLFAIPLGILFTLKERNWEVALYPTILLLTYLGSVLAMVWIRQRRFYWLVWVAVAVNFLIGLVPIFGIVNYIFGIWLVVLMYAPEVRYTYEKLR